jgi:protein-tyrosine kinase
MNSQILPLPNRLDIDISGPAEADRPIGVILVDWGRLTYENAQRILDYQRKAGLPFGEAGIAMGLLGDGDVRQALALQFGQAYLEPGTGLSRELVAAWQPDSEAVEHLRALRSQLMLRWFENKAGATALAVVSPGVGEGRSYLIANLAVLFSQLGKRTLVIDADLRRPRQHAIFGLPGRAGLSGILSGRTGREAIVDIEAIHGLSVLPAGPQAPNPQELLARSGFARLIALLQSSYEVILVDTPAADTCADAHTVAARAGAALLLACRDRSSVPRLGALTDDLREFGVTVVGTVLNGVPAS